MISLTKIDKKSVKIMVLGSLLLVVVFIMGVSYAYTHANFFNIENSTTIAVNGGEMEIVYNDPNSGDYSPNIVANKIIPGWETTKLFTITGTNDIDPNQTGVTNMYYKTGLVVEENTFSEGALKYELTPDNSGATPSGQVLGSRIGSVPQSGTEWFGIGYFVPSADAVVHKYALKISFPDTGLNQNADKGKNFAAYLTVGSVNINDIAQLNIDLGGGTFSYLQGTTLSLEKGSVITLPTPTKEGYEFSGWEIVTGAGASLNGNMLTIGISSISLKANWNPLIPPAGTFATDDWATIAYYASNPVNDSAPYNVGDTREILLTGFTNGEANSGGKYTIRVANNSNYNCTLDSKTACGFVVEFQDIITTHRINATGTTVGGWPATEMRDYLNGTFEGSEATQNPSAIINALPSDLRALIADTTVVSGHGSKAGETNFTSTDKLYLLSTREVWGNCTGGTNNAAGCWDSASKATITRQLDYYASKGVVTSDNSKYKEAIKQLDGSNTRWWLRLPNSASDYTFRNVNSDGNSNNNYANDVYGVAPAFRLG